MKIIGITIAWAAIATCGGAPSSAFVKRTSAATHEVEVPLIDREVFFGDPEISGGRLSPDGRFITFMRPLNGVSNVWVKRRDEPFSAARPLTAAQRPLAGHFWTRDSRWVLFMLDKGGDENFHIWAVDPSGAPAAEGVPQARDLTPGAKVRAELLALPKQRPDVLIVALNERDEQVSDLYRLSLSTGKRELIIENTQNVAGWNVDSAGRVRVAERFTPDGAHEILRVDGQKLVPLHGCPREETCSVIAFHPEGRHAYLASNEGTDLAGLALLDLESGHLTPVESDPEKQVDISGAMFSTVTEELIGTVYEGDRSRIYPRDPQLAHDLEVLRKALPDGDVDFVSTTADGLVSLVANSSDVDPGAMYVYDSKAGTVELLYRPRANLPSKYLAPMKPVHLTARDGVKMNGYLTVPLGPEPKNHWPTVLFVHGGPWARDSWGYDGTAQFLANRGYAVLQVNFRGSTGFGKRFLNLGNGQWGTGTMQSDLTDAANWLVAQGVSDKNRIAIMGASYGGYATLAGLAFTPGVFAAGVDIVGPSNLLTLLASIPPYWEPIRKTFALRVGDPNVPADLTRLKAQSPVFSAAHIQAPLLVIQGANDPRVKQAEADQIVAAMRDLSRPVEYLVAPDEGHGFHGKLNRLAMYVSVERFLAKHLGGRSQSAVTPEVAHTLEALTVNPNAVKVGASPGASP